MKPQKELLGPARLFDSKLQPPVIGEQLVSRVTGITRGRDVAAMPPVITLVAPAGSGKSTLMAELFETFSAKGWSSFWLTLDSDDDNPAVFARYLISALYPLDEAAADREMVFLLSNPANHFDALFDSLVARLCAERRNFCIFIDDFQQLTHPQIVRFWNRLVVHMPTNLKVVIASRTAIPIELGRRRLSGNLLELSHHDLNFDLAQINTFMQQRHNIELETETADLLYSTTEGWVAGLQLMSLAIGKGQGLTTAHIREFSGRDTDLTDYLLQSVFQGLSEDVRTFLLETSALSRMSASLCNAVCGREDGRAMLEFVNRSNLFLIPLDREGRWYRYHHLFAEFLQNELHRNDGSRFADVCRRAAHWCDRHGLTTEAIQYYLAGKEFERAADLIATRAPEVARNKGDHYSILDWMRRLPDEYHERQPELLLAHAWSRAFSRDSDEAMALTDRALALLADPTTSGWALEPDHVQHFRWLAKVTQAIAIACTDDARQCIELAESLRKDVPDSECFVLASICNAIAYGYLALSKAEEAFAAAVEGYAYGKRASSMFALVWSDFLAGLASVELGRINAAAEYAARAVENAGENRDANAYACGLAALVKAETEAQRCDFHAVERSLTLGQAFNRVFGPLEPLLASLRGKARLKAWKGELGGARRVLHQGQEMALGTDQPRLYFALVAEEADLQLRYDTADAARETLRRTSILDTSHPLITPSIQRAVRELQQLSQARLHLAEADYEALLKVTAAIRKSAESRRVTLHLQVRAMRAIAHWHLGHQADAVRELDRAIATAAPEGQLLPFYSVGQQLLDILQAMLASRSSVTPSGEQQEKWLFAAKVVELLGGEQQETNAVPTRRTEEKPYSAPSTEALTERELEILKLVRAGLSNKQLATELFLSVATVKWHLHNVYGKLSVRNRTSAAAYAAAQGWI